MVDLAAEAPFKIADLAVTPALRQVERGGSQLTLEPRVMQVLVALGRHAGRVVSRDELVERCWDGRIVGENAIQRVISRIRQLAVALGGFRLETINKVGYRIVLADADSHHPVLDGTPLAAVFAAPAGEPRPLDLPSSAPQLPMRTGLVSRRLVFAGAAAAVAVGGGAAWRAIAANDGDETAARALIAKGRDAQLAGLHEETVQAVAYFKRATELAPRSAEAWGELALGYRDLMADSDEAVQAAHAAWAGAAAHRALELAPGNVAALTTLATIRPNFRHWAANEGALRQLIASHPGEAPLEGALGWLLCDVGRWREASANFTRTLAREPYHPLYQMLVAWAMWGGGELAEADRMLEGAAKLWPGHRYIWLTRFEFLATMGRPDAAIALVSDVEARPLTPPGDPPPPYPTLLAFATAMRTQTPGDVATAVAAVTAAREQHQLATNSCVTFLCALGQTDLALDRLERFYFGDGRSTIGPLQRRKTSILFSAKGEALRHSPRYAALTRRLGLDDYWRVTATRPDAHA